jgi:DNA replication protein DnaC
MLVGQIFEKMLAPKPTDRPELTPEENAECERKAKAAKRARDSEAKHAAWNPLIYAVGVRYKDARLNNYICQHPGQQNTIDALQDYSNAFPAHCDNGEGIILFGPVGTGKDHLLVGLAHDVIGQHCTGRVEKNHRYFGMIDLVPSINLAWIDGMGFFSGLRAGMDSKQFNEGDYLESLIGPSILILSDPVPPRGILTEYQSAMLFRVIDGRYRECKPTWVTMNVASPAEASERMGAQIVDRLKHGALCIHCNWPSFRQAGQNVITK